MSVTTAGAGRVVEEWLDAALPAARTLAIVTLGCTAQASTSRSAGCGSGSGGSRRCRASRLVPLLPELALLIAGWALLRTSVGATLAAQPVAAWLARGLLSLVLVVAVLDLVGDVRTLA